MADEIKIKRVYRKLTPEERERHRLIREQVERDKPRLNHEALAVKEQIEAAHAAMRILKAEREKLAMSLGKLADLTGIDKANLSRMENNINANPTLETLVRIARALGGTIEVTFRGAA